ncbi:MAG TPA: polymer-forming cytoskeletal protein [Thermoanaerobaculia bacterium]|nr:polymer-forming cytoskeletal protein [Thermoanaerobaculia bacterium]
MWTPLFSNRSAGRRSRRAAVVFLSLGLAVAASFAPAAAAPQGTNPPASAEERASLRQALESRYEVLPVQGGIVLKPRQPRAGISTIEVTAEGVAVNGERVSARTLRDWLGGGDADSVLRLQGLSAAEQRQVFGLEKGSAPPPAATPAPAEPGAETTSGDAAEDETPETAEPAAAETPEPAGSRRTTGSRINVGGSVTVDKDEVADEVVAVGGSATVDGEVEDSVTAVGGPARINGKVGGEVVSVGSSIYLGPNAEVQGDLTSVGGSVHQDPGSKVHGTIHEVGFLPFNRPFGRHFRFGRHWGLEPWPFWGGVSELMGSIMGFIFMGILVCLVLLVAREPFERVARQLGDRPWQAAAAGLAGAVFTLPVAVAVTFLLFITIVGCLLYLLYPFAIFYFLLLLLLGYTAVCYRLGRLFEGRLGRGFGSPYVTTLVGLSAIHVWLILGHLLALLPGPFGAMIWALGVVAFVTAMIVGFGALILARFGFAPGYWPQRGTPVPVVPAPVPPSLYERPAEPLPLSDAHEPEPPAEWNEPPR